MAHALEIWQQKAIELEDKLKKVYTTKKFAKGLIDGAKSEIDYSFKTERDTEWWAKYCSALEKRL